MDFDCFDRLNDNLRGRIQFQQREGLRQPLALLEQDPR